MALSNWDTFALDEKSQPINGVFVSPLGVGVEIYKNWLYVRDKKAWEDGGGYVEPTVMEIHSGSIRYKDVHIEAVRGPKNGVYCAVWSTSYPDFLKEVCQECGARKHEWHANACSLFVDTKWTIMVGVGCSGYTDAGDWVGVEGAEVAFLRDWLHRKEIDKFEMSDGRVHEFAHYDFEDEIRAIDLSKGLRFNQGDMFFANNLGVDPQATPPDEEKPAPHIQGMIEAMKDE